MIGFKIADLITEEKQFSVPSLFGCWLFKRSNNYSDIITAIQERKWGVAFSAKTNSISAKSSSEDFSKACKEIIDICLLLSFLTGKCVTPVGSTPHSDIQFIQLGDHFLRSRAIQGVRPVEIKTSLSEVFSCGITSLQSNMIERRLRLTISHWLGAVTCFTLEDVFLGICVIMDIIVQCEKDATAKNKLTYFGGMQSASNRYGLTPLPPDYKEMRNDLIHEGTLSGSRFKNKAKIECASVIADVLNWLDRYVIKVLDFSRHVNTGNRFRAIELQLGLPAISLDL